MQMREAPGAPAPAARVLRVGAPPTPAQRRAVPGLRIDEVPGVDAALAALQAAHAAGEGYALALLSLQADPPANAATCALALARRLRECPAGASLALVFLAAPGGCDPARVQAAYALGALDVVPAELAPELLGAKLLALVSLAVRAAGPAAQAEPAPAAGLSVVPEAPAELVRSEARFRSLALATSHIVWTTDSAGRVQEDSPSWRAFTGQPREEFLGRGARYLEAIHPEDRERTRNAWTRAVRDAEEGAGLFEVQHRVRRCDGVYRDMLARAAPVRDASGRVCEWVGTNIDLGEGKRSERHLAFLAAASTLLADAREDAEATLQRVAHLATRSLADACLVDLLEEDGSLRRVAVAHADHAREQALQAPGALLPGPGEDSPLWRTVASGRAHLYALFGAQPDEPSDTHLAQLAALGPYGVLVAPLQLRGRVLGVLTLAADAPGRLEPDDVRFAEEFGHRAAVALESARLYHEAKKAVALRDEFLSVASHELKTPLTSLLLRLDSLARQAVLERTGQVPLPAAQLDMLRRQVRKLSDLVDGLLDVTRIGAGRIQLRLEPVDLGALAREVAARFELQAQRAGGRLEVEVPESVIGQWDRLRLDQVVTNLVSNALKYGAGKPVRLRAVLEPDGAHARLEVQDAGIGIAEEHRARIFGRFERAVSERHYGGLGLGLFITHQLVTALGGSVSVASALGEGSTFSVRLPLARGA
ncbi:PAS domain S-box protein [Aggregicoccus sp. 17bor-14]|uniref:sensor histidine kinase n=1 Tax=Myxococcaceae TaxID=31 RepID=UPI00129C80ED|nr:MULTISPECIES: PAS domain-containing sensor histidine kinase [Myxococcaceae]MBF5045305.1 PAS domain-containing sensor histidine kinase [Simulacricoccus sp. 17bor-14]MRI91047.1 PAS domain S-box protein [Aggregicoccus sp. 17bor-14]